MGWSWAAKLVYGYCSTQGKGWYYLDSDELEDNSELFDKGIAYSKFGLPDDKDEFLYLYWTKREARLGTPNNLGPHNIEVPRWEDVQELRKVAHELGLRFEEDEAPRWWLVANMS